ncbi:Phenylalanyl-tRNA synthetase beta chain [hydrothermal vent metagenome]|uniref:Phenylalanine--tRNA ligase beta subunit n=1 Tax=hydrothermal vent metagenome TaxID=652676 RepID=A0A3B1AER2_9ZZZZ
MKFSEQWLREWVNPDIDTATLQEQLTMAGLEVDGCEPVAGTFTNVVVAEVLEVTKHPDADKLNVCKVNTGEAEPLQIVCGAANVRVGLKVPAALVGAKLPGDFKIKKSKLRGVPSHGMLCSTKELGLEDQADGLMELPDDAPVGIAIEDYLKLDDVSIELDLTPNRGDCLSIAGIAREVGVLNDKQVNEIKIEPVKVSIKDTFKVMVKAEQACPHYVGRVIKNVNPSATTPLWMQEKLRRSGHRSLEPLVDVTNYVLLELGQPMHAFDLDKLSKEIVVREAKKKEEIELLDGQQIKLTEGSLLITDASGPVALAGIMGGASTAVSDDTKNIFLESAFFTPIKLAGQARGYGLHTDSSHRFERGVSFELQVGAIERATALLLEIVGGEAGPITEVVSKKDTPSRKSVKLRLERLSRVLGVSFEAVFVETCLSNLGMRFKTTPNGWEVTPPAARFDIEIEEDLIEEIGRIYGYDNIPRTRPASIIKMSPVAETQVGLDLVRQTLVDRGFYEAITYSFIDPSLQAIVDPESDAIALANPISADMSVMRTNLWVGLLDSLQYNLNRQQNRLCLFECGLKFLRQDNEIKQKLVVAGVLSGDVYPEQWAVSNRKVDFFDTKGHVEALLGLTGKELEFTFKVDSHPALHPGQSAAIYLAEGDENQQPIGWIGALHPELNKKLDVPSSTYVFELDASIFEQGSIPAYAAVSKYPAIRRDLAIIVDKNISAQKVMDTIHAACTDIVQDLELFDVYEGEGVDSGRKSLGLGLTLQHLSRTLTDTDVDSEIQNVISTLNDKLGATLRD